LIIHGPTVGLRRSVLLTIVVVRHRYILKQTSLVSQMLMMGVVIDHQK